MVKKYFLIIFLNIFLKFDFRFARRPLVLAVGDHFRYTLNSHFLVRKCKYTKKDQTKKNRRFKNSVQTCSLHGVSSFVISFRF